MLGLGGLLACTPPATSEPVDTDTSGGEVFEEPEFLEPPNDEVQVPTDRTEDLELLVRGIHPGRTRVLLDGQSLGTGQDPAGLALLSSDQLVVRLRGALVPGNHTLQLRTSTPDELLESAEVALTVLPATEAGLAASLEDTPAFVADSLDAQGHGTRGVLLGLDTSSDEVTLHLAPATEGGWDLDDAVALPLVDLDLTDEPRFTVSAQLRTIEDAPRVRVVWRTGSEGRRLLGSDMLWPPSSLHTQELVDLDDTFVDFEYGRLGRPLLLGDTIVVEALLTRDVEQPKAGDRTLLTGHIDPATGRFGVMQASAVGNGRDIDRIEPVRDRLTAVRGGTPGLSARVAGLRTVVYEVDASTGTLSERPGGTSDRFGSLSNALGPPQTILGALDSRWVFAPISSDSPGVFLRRFDDRTNGTSEDISPSANALGALGDVTAPVVSTVIGGLPVFLVPQGSATPVVALLSAGSNARVLPLEGLACDEIVVPLSDGEARELEVACRRGRDIYRGALRLDDEDA